MASRHMHTKTHCMCVHVSVYPQEHACTIHSNGQGMSCVPCHMISSSAHCCSTADTSQVLCARTTARCSSACGHRRRQSPHSATRLPARAGWGATPNTPPQPTAAALHRLPSCPAKRICSASATCGRGNRGAVDYLITIKPYSAISILLLVLGHNCKD